MPKGFDKLTVFAADRDDPHTIAIREARPRAATTRGVAPETPGFASREDAARHYLGAMLKTEPRRTFRSLAERPPEAEDVPDLVLRSEHKADLTNTNLLQFEQTASGVPVFGSRAVVELDDDQEFVSASLNVAELAGVSTEPEVSAAEAKEKLLGYVSGAGEIGNLPEPSRTFIHPPDRDGWRLAWRFRHVPYGPDMPDDLPPGVKEQGTAGCFDAHGGKLALDYDYFVDARDGALLYWFSNSAHIDIPTWCRGEDADQVNQRFLGRSNGAGFELDNPFEVIRTYDLGLNAIETTPLPIQTVQNPTNDWQASNPAAVSAHVNAARVLDFLYRILRRKSIDDQGMALENIVNCFSNQDPSAPEWINAVWWQGRMWYGQEQLGGGAFRSLARYLDIIAHELTHGITENTAGLVYRDLAGALNESISDIFGIIVRNWHLAPDPADVSTWDWRIGPGLGAGGGPMRDMADPGSTGSWWRPDGIGGWTQVAGYPAHMNDYVPLPANYDHGGVHIYSNIHNLAAHGVLTSLRADGTRVFTPEEVAVFYYLALTRLTSLSDFDDARRELIEVATRAYAGNAPRVTEVRDAIEAAYDAVGIV